MNQKQLKNILHLVEGLLTRAETLEQKLGRGGCTPEAVARSRNVHNMHIRAHSVRGTKYVGRGLL
jgi:hypothetical protein